MNAQPNMPAVQVLPAAKNNVMAALTPILQNGELDFSSLDFEGRLAKFQEFKNSSNVNLVMLEQSILSQIPKGVTLVPIPIIPDTSDAWTEEKVTGKRSPDGPRVEPSAEFLLKMANYLGIKLTQTFCGVVKDTGTEMFEILYTASMRLPNGEIISVENVGKAQQLRTSAGTQQAHIKESTDKKAKRNAVKAFLNLPTMMSKADFERPWVLFRPAIKPESPEAIAMPKHNGKAISEIINPDNRSSFQCFFKPANPSAGIDNNLFILFYLIYFS